MEVVNLDDGDDDEECWRHELDKEATCVVHLGRIREVLLQSAAIRRGGRSGNKYNTHKKLLKPMKKSPMKC